MPDIERIQYLLKACSMPTRGQWEELRALDRQLISESGWTLVEDKLPEMVPGLPSQVVFVRVREFGQAPAFAFARCWLSSIPGQSPQWYLDEGTYHLDRPRPIAEQVVAWMPIPHLPHA